MKKALIVIDYQNDFVETEGKLTCGKMAQNIKDNILAAINDANEHAELVYFTKDSHCVENWQDTAEGKLFPIHCEYGTHGHKLYGGLEEDANINMTILKMSYIMPKDWLEFFVSVFDEITLTGVATNICVLQNAIALYNVAVEEGLSPKFIVKENCCASWDIDAHNMAIKYMKDVLGFEVV